VPGEQVVADTGGLPVVDVETETVQLAQDGGDGEGFTVGVVSQFGGESPA